MEKILKIMEEEFGIEMCPIRIVSGKYYYGVYMHQEDIIEINLSELRDQAKLVDTLFHEFHHRNQYINERLKIEVVEFKTYMYGETLVDEEVEAIFDGVRYTAEDLSKIGYFNWPWETDARAVAAEMTKLYFEFVEKNHANQN